MEVMVIFRVFFSYVLTFFVRVLALSVDARFGFDRLLPGHCRSVLTSRLYLTHKLQHSQSKRSLLRCLPPFHPTKTMEAEGQAGHRAVNHLRRVPSQHREHFPSRTRVPGFSPIPQNDREGDKEIER